MGSILQCSLRCVQSLLEGMGGNAFWDGLSESLKGLVSPTAGVAVAGAAVTGGTPLLVPVAAGTGLVVGSLVLSHRSAVRDAKEKLRHDATLNILRKRTKATIDRFDDLDIAIKLTNQNFLIRLNELDELIDARRDDQRLKNLLETNESLFIALGKVIFDNHTQLTSLIINIEHDVAELGQDLNERLAAMHDSQRQLFGKVGSIRQTGEDTNRLVRSNSVQLDRIADSLMGMISEKDGQIDSLRAQLGNALRRIADAEQSGDAAAKRQLDELRAGGDPKLLGTFLDDQIAAQDKVTIELLRERAAVAYATGELDRAFQCLTSILGLEPNDFDAINRLGWVYQHRGDLPAAERQYNRVRELASRESTWFARATGNLGTLATNHGDLDVAERLHREALNLDRKLGRLDGQSRHIGNLGVIADKRGDRDAAEKLHREALEMDRNVGNLEGQARHLGNLGLVVRSRGDFDGAEVFFRESLEIYRALRQREGEASQLGHLAVIADERGDLDAAEDCFGKSLEIYTTLGKLLRQAAMLGNLGAIAETRKHFAEARQLLTQTRDLYAAAGSSDDAKRVQEWLDGLNAK